MEERKDRVSRDREAPRGAKLVAAVQKSLVSGFYLNSAVRCGGIADSYKTLHGQVRYVTREAEGRDYESGLHVARWGIAHGSQDEQCVMVHKGLCDVC